MVQFFSKSADLLDYGQFLIYIQISRECWFTICRSQFGSKFLILDTIIQTKRNVWLVGNLFRLYIGTLLYYSVTQTLALTFDTIFFLFKVTMIIFSEQQNNSWCYDDDKEVVVSHRVARWSMRSCAICLEWNQMLFPYLHTPKGHLLVSISFTWTIKNLEEEFSQCSLSNRH